VFNLQYVAFQCGSKQRLFIIKRHKNNFKNWLRFDRFTLKYTRFHVPQHQFNSSGCCPTCDKPTSKYRWYSRFVLRNVFMSTRSMNNSTSSSLSSTSASHKASCSENPPALSCRHRFWQHGDTILRDLHPTPIQHRSNINKAGSASRQRNKAKISNERLC